MPACRRAACARRAPSSLTRHTPARADAGARRARASDARQDRLRYAERRGPSGAGRAARHAGARRGGGPDACAGSAGLARWRRARGSRAWRGGALRPCSRRSPCRAAARRRTRPRAPHRTSGVEHPGWARQGGFVAAPVSMASGRPGGSVDGGGPGKANHSAKAASKAARSSWREQSVVRIAK